jgi:putative transposase
VRLIISDACLGLVEAAGEVFPQAAWQRCVVHWYRNAFSHVPRAKMREVALMLKAIHAQESRQAAEAKAAAVAAELERMKLSKLAEWMTTSVAETLGYLAFPSEHWRRIRTNNPLERIMREIRRRTRVVGASRMARSSTRSAQLSIPSCPPCSIPRHCVTDLTFARAANLIFGRTLYPQSRA